MPNFEAEREIIAKQLKLRLEEIYRTVYSPRMPIRPVEACHTGSGHGPEPIPTEGWEPFEVGKHWGGVDQTVWFRMRPVVPAEMAGKRVVALIAHHQGNHGTSLVYIDGHPRHGLDKNRDEILLSECAEAGAAYDVVIEAVAAPECYNVHEFKYADIAVFNPLPWEFYWDAFVPLEVLDILPKNHRPRRRLLNLLDKAVKMVDLQRVGTPSYTQSLRDAQAFLRKGLEEFAISNDMGRMAVIGHSHIDTAWMWPIRETRRKIGRTTASMLRLLDRYPDFKFSHSQPIQYEFLQRDYPELFAQVLERVKEGRWDPAGALFVEPDCNITSAESLVRQLLYGIRYFQKTFGVRPRMAWVPDCFGFTWSLPQFLKKAGLEAFSTTKLAWNQFTEFPYGAFHWEGADGSRILTVTTYRYGSVMRIRELIEQYEKFSAKEYVERIPYTVGWGDGGGGTTPEMIEKTRRYKNIVGIPRCEFDTLTDYFKQLPAECEVDKLPVWVGELYLELHRACQISQARTKRYNRHCENGLRDAEFLSTLALLHGGAYPHAELYEAWKPVLVNQFHDILPGSSLQEVYTVAEKEYAETLDKLGALKGRALGHLAGRIDTAGEGIPVVVWNTLSWDRDGYVLMSAPDVNAPFHIRDANGQAAPHQLTADGQLLFRAAAVPSMGYAVYRIVPGDARTDAELLAVSKNGAENASLSLEWDECGRLTRVFDKELQRDVLAPGALGNVLQLFDDRPHRSNAWDHDFNFEENTWEPAPAESIEVRESGPLRAVVRFVRRTENSVITQDLTLYADSPRVDFVTHVDWHEKQVLLKAAFPVNVRASHATYEIQSAAIERANHHNTDFDLARFEVPALRWADLSEGNYGVSLLNDCKYGYDVKGNVLRLSLLRAPIFPDPAADQGEHDFTYSLYPHTGDWRTGTVQEGAELNVPLLAQTVDAVKGELPNAASFVRVSVGHVIVDTVKRAEDSNAVIIRLYEAYGYRGPVTLAFGVAPASVTECDLLEENDAPVEHTGNEIELHVTPFQVRTLKLKFRG